MIADINGKHFGRLTVTEYLGLTPRKQAVWRAVCECGATVVVRAAELACGDTKSCGCLKAAVTRARNRAAAKHQRSRSPEYRSWRSMKDRCLNPNSKDWPRYGGRGIGVDSSWANDFSAFLNDMGVKPSPAHSLERKDVNGPYNAANCTWALPLDQAANRRSTRLVNGKPLAHWAREVGISPTAMYKRIKKYGSIHGANT